jgi:hypothetical protein
MCRAYPGVIRADRRGNPLHCRPTLPTQPASPATWHFFVVHTDLLLRRGQTLLRPQVHEALMRWPAVYASVTASGNDAGPE